MGLWGRAVGAVLAYWRHEGARAEADVLGWKSIKLIRAGGRGEVRRPASVGTQTCAGQPAPGTRQGSPAAVRPLLSLQPGQAAWVKASSRGWPRSRGLVEGGDLLSFGSGTDPDGHNRPVHDRTPREPPPHARPSPGSGSPDPLQSPAKPSLPSTEEEAQTGTEAAAPRAVHRTQGSENQSRWRRPGPCWVFLGTRWACQ